MASRAVATVSFKSEQHSRMSCTKYIERRIICVWKSISRRSRRRYRASVLPEDFVILTSRRRSVRYV